MNANNRLPQDRPAFVRVIKPNRWIGAIVGLGLVVTALAAFEATPTHQPIAAHTEASDSIAPATKVGRGGVMLVLEPVW